MIIDDPGPFGPSPPEPGPQTTPEQCPQTYPGLAAPVAWGLWRAVIGVSRVVVSTVFVTVALLGAAVTPALTMLTLAPLVGALAAGITAAINPGFPVERSARRAAVFVGAASTMLVPFISGAGALGDTGGALAFALLVLGFLLAADWLIGGGGGAPDGAASHDVAGLRNLLRELPVAVLLDEWRATETVLQAQLDGPDRNATVQIRGLLLDELTRRDPVGVHRWLEDGGRSPERHIRTDPDPTG
jgi:hypothetical protein